MIAEISLAVGQTLVGLGSGNDTARDVLAGAGSAIEPWPDTVPLPSLNARSALARKTARTLVLQPGKLQILVEEIDELAHRYVHFVDFLARFGTRSSTHKAAGAALLAATLLPLAALASAGTLLRTLAVPEGRLADRTDGNPHNPLGTG